MSFFNEMLEEFNVTMLDVTLDSSLSVTVVNELSLARITLLMFHLFASKVGKFSVSKVFVIAFCCPEIAQTLCCFFL